MSRHPLTGEELTRTRKMQVLRGIAAGHSYREIADQLHLAEGTVKIYARRLFEDLGVDERAAAVDQGWRRRLLRRDNKRVTPGTQPLTIGGPSTSHTPAVHHTATTTTPGVHP